jgi:hypothetical protein
MRDDGMQTPSLSLGNSVPRFGEVPGTFELWIKRIVLDPGQAKFILDRRGPGGTSASGPRYQLFFFDEKIHFERHDGSGGDETLLPSTPVTVDAWFHVALTSSGTRIEIFLNGQLALGKDKTVTLPDSTGSLIVGSFAGAGPSSAAAAVIDELAIYDKVLPADRIAAHYMLARR